MLDGTVPVQTQGELQEASSLAEERVEELEALEEQLQQAMQEGTASAKVRSDLACMLAAQRSSIVGNAWILDPTLRRRQSVLEVVRSSQALSTASVYPFKAGHLDELDVLSMTSSHHTLVPSEGSAQFHSDNDRYPLKVRGF